MDSKFVVFGAGLAAGLGVAYCIETQKRTSIVGVVGLLVTRWDSLDTNKDGQVDKDEFINGVGNLYGGGKDLSKSELAKLHAFIMATRAQLDTNSDGNISVNELFSGLKAALGALSGKAIRTSQDLKDALHMFKTGTSLTIVPGVNASVLGREWRCTFTTGNGNAGGLINSKALEEAQKLLDGTLAQVKSIAGVQRVARVVCGGCQDFKVIIAAGVDDYKAWEANGFAPEKDFLEKLGKIGGITGAETQTYTYEEFNTKVVPVGDQITLVPGVNAGTLGREWRCKFTPSSGSPAEGALICSTSLEKAQEVFDVMLDELKAIPSVCGINRTVCGSCQDFKINIVLPLKEYTEWEARDFAPEKAFCQALSNLQGIHNVETQKYTFVNL